MRKYTLSMVEGIGGTEKRNHELTGLGEIAIAKELSGEVRANIAEVLLGESEEDIESRYHAAKIYMDYGSGELKENFRKIVQIAERVKRGDYKGREAKIDEDCKPIYEKKEVILEKLDRHTDLIPSLLSAYVKAGLGPYQKSLVGVYQGLGGNLKSVREHGIDGVDKEVVSNIGSVMGYDIERTFGEEGNVICSELRFVRKSELQKDTD